MAEPVISVAGLGKRYVIGHEARHDTFRDTLAHGAVGALRRLFRRAPARTTEEFWALRDVSFEVNQGDVVGIIGRNGAGKSTLLKILSRITEPTVGSVRLRGRVASLLEVGTGFHPELSGRENIYLNGAILGMSRAEIARKFDEIVAFAEVERFLDTPVKHYSSGMYVRLAFAVAAHLEPEILIVDEVLAVGDAQFQQKCLGKVQRVVREEGRTVLLVSHSMVVVQQFSTCVLSLHQGRMMGYGDTAARIREYHGSEGEATQPVCDLVGRRRAADGRGKARLLTAELETPDVPSPWKVPFASPLRLRLTAEALEPLAGLELGIGLFSLQGQEIISTLSTWHGDFGPIVPGKYALSIDYGVLELVPGYYRLGIGLKSSRGMEDYLPEAIEFEVVTSPYVQRPNLMTVRGAIARTARYTLARI